MAPKNAKIWNEDLVRALEARMDQARRECKRSQYTWGTGMDVIRSVRKDIYVFGTGRIVNLPQNKLSLTVYNLCVEIINGRKNVLPDGYVPQTAEERAQVPTGNPFFRDPYLKTIKRRSGAYAILMAFHCSQDQTLTKARLCQLAQPWCDEEMDSNYHAGKMYGAWAGNKTLTKHGLISSNGGARARYVEGVGFRATGQSAFTLTDNGKLFIEAMLQKFPLTPDEEVRVGVGGAAGPNPFMLSTSPTKTSFAESVRNVNSTPIRRPPSRGVRAAKSVLKQGDEQDLRNWAAVARVGEERTFQVGKDRRKRLHDLCDELMAAHPGLLLMHESYGPPRKRTLRIRLSRKPAEVSLGSGVEGLSPILVASSPAAKGSIIADNVFSGAGKTLGGDHVARSNGTSATEAAKLAALERFAVHESKRLAEHYSKKRPCSDDDDDLQRALLESITTSGNTKKANTKRPRVRPEEDSDLERVLKESLSTTKATPRVLEDLSISKAVHQSLRTTIKSTDLTEDGDESDLQRAIRLSMSTAREAAGNNPTTGSASRLRKQPLSESVASKSARRKLFDVQILDSDSDSDDLGAPVFSPPSKASPAARKKDVTRDNDSDDIGAPFFTTPSKASSAVRKKDVTSDLSKASSAVRKKDVTSDLSTKSKASSAVRKIDVTSDLSAPSHASPLARKKGMTSESDSDDVGAPAFSTPAKTSPAARQDMTIDSDSDDLGTNVFSTPRKSSPAARKKDSDSDSDSDDLGTPVFSTPTRASPAARKKGMAIDNDSDSDDLGTPVFSTPGKSSPVSRTKDLTPDVVAVDKELDKKPRARESKPSGIVETIELSDSENEGKSTPRLSRERRVAAGDCDEESVIDLCDSQPVAETVPKYIYSDEDSAIDLCDSQRDTPPKVFNAGLVDLCDSRDVSTLQNDTSRMADEGYDVEDVAEASKQSVQILEAPQISIDRQRDVVKKLPVNPYLSGKSTVSTALARRPHIATARPDTLQLSIYIDNRERNRNHTPRQLRMNLTELVSKGLVKTVWPVKLPIAVVEEHSLSHGDFSFLIGEGESKQELSIALERKRIGDLVQRSVKGDHWKQFCKMRDSFEHAIFLVEYDTRQAARFNSEGEQGLDGWNPFETYIGDESTVFLYFGRSLLSHRSWRLIQTASEQSSLRAVGALGLMASQVASIKAANSVALRGDAQSKLKYRLSDAGIPWQLARNVAREVGSEARLEDLYQQSATEGARLNLFTQIARFVGFDDDVKGTPEGWSAAIYHAFFSILSDPTEARSALSEYKESVSDHAQLLCALHSIPSSGGALDSVSTGAFPKRPKTPGRSVRVHSSKDVKRLIEEPTEKSFWNFSDSTEETLPIGTIRMQACSGMYMSLPLVIRVLPATDLIARVTDALSNKRGTTDFVGGAKGVASGIMQECVFPRSKKAYRLILLRGLPAALTAAGKRAGCRPELSVVVDLVMSSLMLEHQVVVIQAVRKQDAETKLILRQLLLACLHYTYLTEEGTKQT